jgi:8-oxo-dGTP pyrophosphatase MutT (NUDIX family)
MLELLAQGERAFNRENYRPGHFTASAFVIDETGERVLLVHHKKLGRWLQPGGHVEPTDHDVVAAARREVTEETGASALTALDAGLFDLDIHEIPSWGDKPAHLHFDVRCLFRADRAELAPNDEVVDVRWVELAELARKTDDESVLRVARKLAR